MFAANLLKTQFWLIFGASALALWLAPDIWHYSPDGGIYVGTAKNLAETGAYRFNGHPNLLYYPGLSSLLGLSIYVFGLNFQILHLLCASMVVVCLWLARTYFSTQRHGMVGLALPLILMMAGILQRQVFNILSDGIFLAIILSALLLWRRYAEVSRKKYLIACCCMVALAPLVRFEGLLLGAALGGTLLIERWRGGQLNARSLIMLAAIGATLLTPFALWTLRNWMLYTPDTFNVANGFFFGLKGLQLYATDAAVNADTPLWHFALVRLTLFLTALATTFVDSGVVDILPLPLWVLILLGLSALGFPRWFKGATIFERVFVILMLVFLFVWTLKGGRSVYVVPRYWLGVLPFVIALMSYGVVALYHAAGSTILRHGASALAIALISLTAIAGTARVIDFTSREAFYKNADQVIQKAVDYVAKTAPPTLPIATTDWGVMPFRLGRPSYQILNDVTHRQTLQRMLRYRTGYLVILDRLAAFPPVARRLVAQYPEIFTLVFEASAPMPGPGALIYIVDLKAVELALGGFTAETRHKIP